MNPGSGIDKGLHIAIHLYIYDFASKQLTLQQHSLTLGIQNLNIGIKYVSQFNCTVKNCDRFANVIGGTGLRLGLITLQKRKGPMRSSGRSGGAAALVTRRTSPGMYSHLVGFIITSRLLLQHQSPEQNVTERADTFLWL